MREITPSQIRTIHFVGVKGVGMTPLAIIAKEAGFLVTGCDLGEYFITDESLEKAQIPVFTGFSGEHLNKVDLVITTGAHGGLNNPEVKEALEKNIPVVTQGEALGIFMKGDIFERKFFGISIAGCHGKTTTTAMIATMFDASGLEPSYVVGTSMISSLGLPGHFGKGKYFVAEADEYATEPKLDHTPKFLWQHPSIAVFTNIEHDHPDIYPTIEDTRKAYLKFAKNIHQKGVLVAFGDDDEIKKLLLEYSRKTITYGFSAENDYIIKDVLVKDNKTSFTLDGKDISLGTFVVGVVGQHNALNATATIITGIECGLSLDAIQKGLLAFSGTKRRFEIRGEITSGGLLIDDYAHHPTEIKNTLRAAREQFKTKKIVCIFQPHTYSRTKLLFHEFSSSFIPADEVILTNIYASAREDPDPSVSSEMLIAEIHKFNRKALLLPELSDVVKYIKQKKFDEHYVLITMGAGDIYKIGDELLKD